MDVSQLTDVELRESLKSHGVSVGPIVATTRKLYEKKLLKLAGNNANNVSQTELNDSQLNDSQLNGGDDEDIAVEKSFTPIFQKSPSPKKTHPPRVFQKTPTPSAAPESDSDDCEESMRFLTEEEMAADRAAARQSLQGDNKKGGFLGNTITVTILFVCIAVFAYFLIENAEQLKLIAEPNPEDAI